MGSSEVASTATPAVSLPFEGSESDSPTVVVEAFPTSVALESIARVAMRIRIGGRYRLS